MNIAALFIRATDNKLYSPVLIDVIKNKHTKQINDYLEYNNIKFVHSMFNTIVIRSDYDNGFRVGRATWTEGYLKFDTFEEAFEKIKEWLDF